MEVSENRGTLLGVPRIRIGILRVPPIFGNARVCHEALGYHRVDLARQRIPDGLPGFSKEK